jgi:hypothetical protein
MRNNRKTAMTINPTVCAGFTPGGFFINTAKTFRVKNVMLAKKLYDYSVF